MKQIIEDKYALNEIQEQTYIRHLETLKMLGSINQIPLQKNQLFNAEAVAYFNGGLLGFNNQKTIYDA